MKDNDHVEIHEIRGFVSEDIRGVFSEAHALSKATKCKQYIYSLSLNPPEEAKASIDLFEKTINRTEKRLGLEGQPRVIVIHEKEGRRHAHCVWSRINIDEMKAINMSYDHTKLNQLSKELYLEHGWKMPKGFIDKNQKNPLNFTREEWQQAQRTGQNPKLIKQSIQECWAVSDSKKAFEQALQERGYFLARGDKRGFVTLDTHGEVYSLARQLGMKAKDLEQRLGKPQNLPSVDHAKNDIAGRLSKKFKNYSDELRLRHEKENNALLAQKKDIVIKQRAIRRQHNERQHDRAEQEQIKRAERLRKGFKGLWDRLTGAYQRTRRQNENELQKSELRDRNEKQKLIDKQLTERQSLQAHIKEARQRQHEQRLSLLKSMEKQHQDLGRQKELAKLLEQERKKQTIKPDNGPDFEPEI